ncbi:MULTISPECIES: phosphomannomutase CpsG [unclassified Moraxella]|uniref:phosphomannomutase CpsG n=1 Tax=unclassified Moraxella TaxID=2685852 RepID=UPI003AF9E9C8
MSIFQPITISSFKAYDIRGELGVNLDEAIAYRIGRAFAEFLNPNADKKAIVIGCDIRPSSESLKKATIEGILDAGTDVIDLGMTGTEEVYFATSHYDAIGGIEVTASHNPINYNGLKLVRENSKPISADTGLADIQKIAEQGDFKTVANKGEYTFKEDKTAYIDHLMSYIDVASLKPLNVVVNCGNGSAGTTIDLIEQRFQSANAPINFIKINHEPDGSFPNGIPNPMIIANRTVTADKVVAEKADLAIAFDGDFDRCFFFDENARFLEGTYVVGVLAKAFLDKEQGASIVYDPRNILNTEAVIAQAKGKAVISKSGHSFIKQVMRESNAVYGGEMSAHHYFRDFNYCDSGMIPWLLVIELLSKSGKSLSKLVDEMIEAYPISGEINFKLTGITAPEVLAKLESEYRQFDDQTASVDKLDGLSVNFPNWRFNVRASNTEPLIRLNVESKGDKALLDAKTTALQNWIIAQGGSPADH